MIDTALQDLQLAVEDALWRYDPLRPALSELRVEVRPDGQVEIAGPVRTGLIKDGILASVRRVPGVTGIIDRILPDHELEIAVARSMASDEMLTKLPPGTLSVHSHLGRVSLVGKVPDPALRKRVLEIVRSLAGVQGVVDLMG